MSEESNPLGNIEIAPAAIATIADHDAVTAYRNARPGTAFKAKIGDRLDPHVERRRRPSSSGSGKRQRDRQCALIRLDLEEGLDAPEALGLDLDRASESAEPSLNEIGICFLFAQKQLIKGFTGGIRG